METETTHITLILHEKNDSLAATSTNEYKTEQKPSWMTCRFSNIIMVQQALLPFRSLYLQYKAKSPERKRVLNEAMLEVGKYARPPWTISYMRAWFKQSSHTRGG